ncbi:TldD/PmbA family protein [Kordiimonas laminariae]|uniref:TldD/PmbA family protein n=1 Tax=Kordiimonas laminariae TaxID=2917717 RepID=UPI001FF4223E|nr:TldD/PmbA family protein [Kordiimonas laminariae]MCK0068212.1 TldD/PmbA family protein [Kordiimonas laminariae]
MSQSSDSTLDLLDDLVKAALKGGADAADAVAVDARSKGVSWREGQMEDVEGSEGEDIGLRVMIGKQQAMVSTSNRSTGNLKEVVERTLAMARAVPEDQYCGLAPEDKLHTGPFAELDLYDDTEVSAEQLAEIAREAEEATRAVEGVTTSPGAGASASSWAIDLVTSHGFAGHYKGSSFSSSVSAVAGEGTGMERDYDFTSTRHFADLESAAAIGTKAGELAVKRLNPTKAESGQKPLVFSPRVANSLLGHFAGAISGGAVARGTSFLKDRLGEAVFADGVTIVDNPLMKRGLSSKLFDGEGVRVQKMNLVESGTLKTWTLNSATARQLEMEVTGHASRGTSSAPGIGTTNLYMEAGTLSPEKLMADIADGIYITELIGMGVNGVTGDYSRGASGFMIKNGEITESVSEFTIAGNLKDMFMALVPASDLEFKYGANAPTVRIDGMMVAGT